MHSTTGTHVELQGLKIWLQLCRKEQKKTEKKSGTFLMNLAENHEQLFFSALYYIKELTCFVELFSVCLFVSPSYIQTK